MALSTAMRDYGRAARFKAGLMGHQMKDRALEKRLDRASSEADRLRFENEMLRDEVEEARSEHRRILDMLEERLPEHSENGEHRSHKGRWLLFLLAIGGGVYAFVRSRQHDAEPGSYAAEGTAGI
jgi:hypothetical protein